MSMWITMRETVVGWGGEAEEKPISFWLWFLSWKQGDKFVNICLWVGNESATRTTCSLGVLALMFCVSRGFSFRYEDSGLLRQIRLACYYTTMRSVRKTEPRLGWVAIAGGKRDSEGWVWWSSSRWEQLPPWWAGPSSGRSSAGLYSLL